ncbi:MAG: sugar ABC transporter permease [Actinomycetota bacterium]|jgi:raffinose/stachyose/melibiose transport system permease protein|nr:sugar ABC transporter permease [Actinomycetota bacterium]
MGVLATTAQRTRLSRGASLEPRAVGYAYIAPALSILSAFLLVPLGYAIYVSFFNWSGAGPLTFAGLSNYIEIVKNPQLLSAFYHSAILILFFAVLPIALALLLVALMTRVAIRGLTVYRTVLFLPQVIPLVAVAVVWEWVLGENGPVNSILRDVGASSLAQAWLGSFTWALPAIGIIGTWIGYGFAMVIFMAGVEKIPQSLYDAARVDGAGPVREFFAVTLPGLRNELLVVAVITVTSALTTFDIVYIITLGGPGTSTIVPAYSAFTLAFTDFQIGAAAAMGVVLGVIVFLVAIGILALDRRSRR